MARTFRYVTRRGFFIALLAHSLYKALWQVSRANAGDRIKLKWPPFTFLPTLINPPGLELVLVYENDGIIATFEPRWWVKLAIKCTYPNSLRLYIEEQLRKAFPKKRAFENINALQAVFVFTLLGSIVIIFNIPWYAASALMRGLAATLRSALRLVPALFAILIVLFITGDAWKTFGLEPTWRFITLLVIIAAIAIIATLFATRDLNGGWRSAAGYTAGDTELLARWASATPAHLLAAEKVRPALPPFPPKSKTGSRYLRAHEFNIYALYVITVIGHLIAVAFWAAFTFIFIGLIALTGPMTRELLGNPGNIIASFTLFGQSFIMTRQLIFVSIILGGIAALTFATVTLQDEASRRSFADNALVDVKRGLGALSYYYGSIIALLSELGEDGALEKIAGDGARQLTALLQVARNAAGEEQETLNSQR